jgi:2-polyprenyl-3-methyl-5-hydroxy-6-metoxy-1,4-benzoquinol methylase
MYTDRRYIQTQVPYATDDLETMSGAKRYQAHIFGLFRRYIGARVLEVGCGIGTTTRNLLEISDHVLGIEPNRSSADRVREAIGAHPRFRLRECHLEECDQRELAQERFDTIVCINVLEHIEDDVQALRTFREIVTPANGHVLIFVPAVQGAYGPLDAELGHHRRYSKRSLAAAFNAAGLELSDLRYTNPIGLLGWLFNARFTKSIAHSPRQIALFEALVAPWALPLERLLPMPIGLSLVAVGRPNARTK